VVADVAKLVVGREDYYDALGPLFTDEQLAERFAARGRPAWSPARLVLVLVFVEGLTDRQAADAVRARLDWNLRAGP
jgi:hypothetical protein